MKRKLSPRAALLIIAALFVVPLVLAWLMYSGTIAYRPASTRNLGNLVEPPVPTSWDAMQVIARTDGDAGSMLAGHWVVLKAIRGPCGPGCMDEVTALRQVHRAAGRQQGRIRLALLLPDNPPRSMADDLTRIYPQFLLLEDPSGRLRSALEQAAAGHRDYLIDPLGNIMMSYANGSDPNDLKQDLKRLLTWSKLDEQ